MCYADHVYLDNFHCTITFDIVQCHKQKFGTNEKT